MAVYTRITDDALGDFVARYDIGGVESCTGIAQGIENSNYMLRTGRGNFILTLYEKRVRAEDLPFYLGLMSHLAAQGFPCPVPISDREGRTLLTLAGRPAAIASFLDGRGADCDDLTPERCAAIGAVCARLHRDAAGFELNRPNDLTLPDWRGLFDPLSDKADSLKPCLSGWIEDELSFLETQWPVALPTGIVHADLFPDNAFFKGSELTGVIDFYFACNDFLTWDLAVCINAWCFDIDGAFLPDNATSLLRGYQETRPLAPAERDTLPVLARGAALRFLLTRLHDWFHTPDDALAHRKDPLDLVPLIEFHRSVSDSTAYGVS
ncbi:MAG: homoserine kinase type II [Paracoccaceae bacterium]|jgi:homoserine kinase type II